MRQYIIPFARRHAERETAKNCRRNDGDDPKTVDEMTRSRFLLKKSVGAREYLPLGGGFPADELR